VKLKFWPCELFWPLKMGSNERLSEEATNLYSLKEGGAQLHGLRKSLYRCHMSIYRCHGLFIDIFGSI